MAFITTKQMIEYEASEIFKPFIAYSNYKNNNGLTNFYTIFNNEIRFYYIVKNTTIKTYDEIIVGKSKNDLLKKIRAIKRYLYEIELKRIK